MANFLKKLFGKEKEEEIQQEELLDGEEQLSDEEIEKLLFEEEDLEGEDLAGEAVQELEISEVQADDDDEFLNHGVLSIQFLSLLYTTLATISCPSALRCPSFKNSSSWLQLEASM